MAISLNVRVFFSFTFKHNYNLRKKEREKNDLIASYNNNNHEGQQTVQTV